MATTLIPESVPPAGSEPDQERAPLAFDLAIDRDAEMPLVEQIYGNLRAAILDRRLVPGARLPSWRDLAVRLGVARGTVRAAYERLIDEFMIVSAGAAGTHVAKHRSNLPPPSPVRIARPLEGLEYEYSARPLPFQLGVPAEDAFPIKLWTRLNISALREDAAMPVRHPDPRGRPELRTQIAAYLGIARGIRCLPDQVIVTSNFKAGLNLALRTLQAEGRQAWMEEPGLPFTRIALELAGITPVPVPVDAHGIDVKQGMALAPEAAIAVVTPGQQAPTGVVLTPARRRALLAWAARSDSWIIEDDYLSDLQLKGRAAPALAATDPDGRVIHVGTFSKTLSPSVGLGFVVAPLTLAERFGQVAGSLAPAPGASAQLALARLFAEGHYLRHLRRMKRLYTDRATALHVHLRAGRGVEAMAGLALMLPLPPEADDVAIAQDALAKDIAPMALSLWYADPAQRRRGLLLNVTNLRKDVVGRASTTLKALLEPHAFGA